jgi:hypothetical protein
MLIRVASMPRVERGNVDGIQSRWTTRRAAKSTSTPYGSRSPVAGAPDRLIEEAKHDRT